MESQLVSDSLKIEKRENRPKKLQRVFRPLILDPNPLIPRVGVRSIEARFVKNNRLDRFIPYLT